MVAQIKVAEGNVSLADLPRAMRGMEDQIPFATALAMTRMAQDGRRSVQAHLEDKLDNPTKWTIKGVRFTPASKTDTHPTSSVWLVDEAPKGTAPADYLSALIKGGRCRHKRHEKALHRAGILPAGWLTVPGQDVRLNKHGNITAGKYTQILSELQASSDPQQNATGSARSTQSRKGFFVLRKGDRPVGVYQRKGKRTIKSILHFVHDVSYEPTLDIEGTVEEALRLRSNQHVDDAIETAINSATKRQGRQRARTVEATLKKVKKQAGRQAVSSIG
jgi:hypothetical protein